MIAEERFLKAQDLLADGVAQSLLGWDLYDALCEEQLANGEEESTWAEFARLAIAAVRAGEITVHEGCLSATPGWEELGGSLLVLRAAWERVR